MPIEPGVEDFDVAAALPEHSVSTDAEKYRLAQACALIRIASKSPESDNARAAGPARARDAEH
jgi:hypothetical protein